MTIIYRRLLTMSSSFLLLSSSSRRKSAAAFVVATRKICGRASFSSSSQASTTTTTASAAAASSSSSSDELTKQDMEFLQEAVAYAKKGLGHTFPNPAVGCVLVDYSSNTNTSETDDKEESQQQHQEPKVIGAGFHPRAGYPHAEVFALLEAAGHVDSGVEAAQAVVQFHNQQRTDPFFRVNLSLNANFETDAQIQEFTQQYINSDRRGPERLFADCLKKNKNKNKSDNNKQARPRRQVTAYVTLEPCSHYGQTPPCASTLVTAGVSRVVVGFRDPNPRVDGGGVALLQQHGIAVDLCHGKARRVCANLVTNFVKRITERPENAKIIITTNNANWVTGKMRRALRAHVQRHSDEIVKIEYSCNHEPVEPDQAMEFTLNRLTLSPEWLEHVDAVLWKHELVILQLRQAVAKRQGCTMLGKRIAKLLQAHLVQSRGHTVLLYRPGIPPVLNLYDMVNKDDNDKKEKAEQQQQPRPPKPQ